MGVVKIIPLARCVFLHVSSDGLSFDIFSRFHIGEYEMRFLFRLIVDVEGFSSIFHFQVE